MSRTKVLAITLVILFVCDVIWRDASILTDLVKWKQKITQSASKPSEPPQTAPQPQSAPMRASSGPRQVVTGEDALAIEGGPGGTNASNGSQAATFRSRSATGSPAEPPEMVHVSPPNSRAQVVASNVFRVKQVDPVSITAPPIPIALP